VPEVIVLVPEVAANVMAVADPAGMVIPETSVKLPLMVFGNVGPVPENPVKLRSWQLVTLVNVMVPDPAEIQILGMPEREPPFKVLFVEETLVNLMVAVVELKVNPVVPERSKGVPVPEIDQVPVLILSVLVVVAPLKLNAPIFKFLPLASNVPCSRVKVTRASPAKLSANWTVPATPRCLIVSVCPDCTVIVFPLLVITCVPEVALRFQIGLWLLAVMIVMVAEKVKFPYWSMLKGLNVPVKPVKFKS